MVKWANLGGRVSSAELFCGGELKNETHHEGHEEVGGGRLLSAAGVLSVFCYLNSVLSRIGQERTPKRLTRVTTAFFRPRLGT